MKFSIIDESKISPDKSGYLSHVDYIATVDTLSEFASALTQYHIAPATFVDGHRSQSNIESIEFVCFDFDDGKVTSDKIHNQLVSAKLNHVIVGSKNHLKDKGDGKGIIERFHVFIPLDSPINSIPLYKEMAKALPMIHNWSVDRSCSDASRYFYRHSSILYVHSTASHLSVFQYERRLRQSIEIAEHNAKVSAKKFANCKGEAIVKFKRTRAYSDIESGILTSDGNRYASSSRIIGVMLKCGVSQSDALSVFDEFAEYGNGFTRESVERRYAQWNK